MTTGYEHIADDAVPAVAILLGDEAPELVSTVAAAGGGSLRSSRADQVRYTPGRSIVVRYRTDIRWADGRVTRPWIVASSGIPVPDGTIVISAGDVEIAVWAYPNDPFLPGLATAADPDRVKALLGPIGIQADRVDLRVRAYRPGRRAVVEARTPRGRMYLKIVRPDGVADLQAKHRAFSTAIPVPRSHGWKEHLGLVALQAMPGKPLRKALESGSRKLPEPGRFPALLDRLPVLEAASIVRGPDERAAFHARLLRTVLPDLTGRIDAIADAVARVPRRDEDEVAVHGDFHSSQVLVRGSQILGLIDVDTAGLGARSDDYAVLLSHLATVALGTSARKRIDRYGAGLIRAFDARVDPAALRLKVAAAVLGLATGPFRVNVPRWPAQTERRIALAERWIESASAV